MMETDPISTASQSLQAAVETVLKGGDPNLLKAPYMALLRARGNGKQARVVEGWERLVYVKPPK
jgi:hypothetical protein